MAKIDIKLSGLTTTPSDYLCADGTLAVSHNIINKDGEMRSIFPGTLCNTLPNQHTLLCVHTAGIGYKHIITKKGNALYWSDYEDGKDYTDADLTKLGDDGTQEIGAGEGFVEVKTIGNFVVYLTKENVYYYLWGEGKYDYMGNTLPDLPKLFFSLSVQKHYNFPMDRYKPQIYDHRYGPNLTTTAYRQGNDWELDQNGYEINDIYESEQDDASNFFLGVIEKKTREEAEAGRFCNPFFVRYALRLYNGDVVKCSPLVLMMPSSKFGLQAAFQFQKSGHTTYNEIDYLCANYVFARAVGVSASLRVQQKDEMGASLAEFRKWKDIIQSVDVFVSAPIYQYDQGGKVKRFVRGKDYESKLDENQGFFMGYDGVSGFAKQDIEIQTQEDLTPDPLGIIRYKDRTWYPELPKKKYTSEELLTIGSTCYKVASIEWDKFCTDDTGFLEASTTFTRDIPLKLDGGALTSLEAREALKDEYLSLNYNIPHSLYVYNNRLLMAGMRRKLFGGFDLQQHFSFPTSESREVTSYFVTTHKKNTTYTIKHKACGYTLSTDYLIYFYYPDPDATRIDINLSNGKHISLTLKRHETLSGAYWFDNFNSAIEENGTIAEPTGASDNVIIEYPNTLYTSEVDAPVYFPAAYATTIGNGNIIGLSTALLNMNEQQYGTFNIIVFSSDGVWSANIDGQGRIIARVPFSRDICVSKETITSIDNGVVFATEDEVKLISGRTIVSLSSALRDTFFNSTAIPKLYKLANEGTKPEVCFYTDTLLPDGDIKAFINGCKIVWSASESRVILHNDNMEYNYVIDIYNGKNWALQDAQEGDRYVNAYPFTLMQRGTEIYNIDKPDYNNAPPTFILTRPIKFGKPDDLKRVSEVDVCGHFYGRKGVERFRLEKRAGGDIKTAIFGSTDGWKWRYLGSSVAEHIRNIEGSKYRYFMVGIAPGRNLTRGKTISRLSFEVSL